MVEQIDEDVILGAIVKYMGWEEMDIWAFTEAVKKVILKGGSVELVLAEDTEEDEYSQTNGYPVNAITSRALCRNG